MSTQGVMRGKLQKGQLPQLMQMLGQSGDEGTLYVSDGESKKSIYFSKEGISLTSSGKRQPTSLRQRFLAKGKLTKVQLDKAIVEYRKSGKLLGHVLIERGLVSQQDVEEAVCEQITEEIFDLLEWEGAEFEFQPGPPTDVDPQSIGRRLTFDVSSVLLEAARRGDEWNLVKEKVKSFNEVLVPATLHKTQTDLSGELSAAFAMVDGKSTMKEIVEKLHTSRLEAAKALVQLVDTGVARLATRDELCRLAQSSTVQGDYEKQAELYELAVQRQDDAALRQQLAEVLERAGRRERAAEQYKQLAEASLKAGDVHGGVDFLRHVVRLVPSDGESRERLIQVLLELKSTVQACIQIRRQAQLFAEEGQADKAIQEYRRLLEVSPGDFEAQRQIVDLLAQQERFEEAFREAESLGKIARTPGERDQVMKFLGRLVATRPGFTDAQKMLEAMSVRERRRVKRDRVSFRVLAIVGVVLVVVLVLGGYHGLAILHFKKALAESDALVQKGDCDGAIKVLAKSLEGFTYGRGRSEAERRYNELQQEKQRQDEARKANIAERRKSAAELEEKGDLKGAATALLWVADQMEKEHYAESFDLRQKAGRLLDLWSQAEKVFQEAQASAEKPDGCQRAHEEILRLWKIFPKPAAFLDAKLPVLVKSAPEGAEVKSEGTTLGKTPLVVRKAPGKPLALSITGADGRTVSKTIEDDKEWEVSVNLAPPK